MKWPIPKKNITSKNSHKIKTQILNIYIFTKGINQNLPIKKTAGPDGFTGETMSQFISFCFVLKNLKQVPIGTLHIFSHFPFLTLK